MLILLEVSKIVFEKLNNVDLEHIMVLLFKYVEKVFMDENRSAPNLKCNNCNAEVPPGTRFCTECGTAIEEIPKTLKKGIKE